MGNTVLIVDDDVEIRELLSTMLAFVGFQPQVAGDGLEAWQQIQIQQPDLIILDVMMPQMDGLTLCQKLRGDEETAGLPIIMLSGKAHPEAIEEGLRAGADRYLTKPMAMTDLTRQMNELLHYPSLQGLEV